MNRGLLGSAAQGARWRLVVLLGLLIAIVLAGELLECLAGGRCVTSGSISPPPD